ncbi:MAG: LegC family aminotransferase [Lachnospiraceae bacterium]
MQDKIPLSVPNFQGNEELYVSRAVREGWVSTGGAYITQFEEKIADFLGVNQAVACQSGTAALHLALIECGVLPGDCVIVPTLTFIAAVNPVKYQFAEPIFMDCDDGLCMDADKLKAYCEQECEYSQGVLRVRKTGQAIRAVVVVHVFGNTANMESIMQTAKKYGLSVIEDATEALGTKFTTGIYQGKYAGTIGDFGAFSFNGNKIITTGGGGMIVAADEKKLAHIQYLSTQAKDDPLFYIHKEVGYNYRMTNVQAAMGVAQMEELREFIRRKRENYSYYKELFSDCQNLRLLDFREGTEANCWFYSLVLELENKTVKELVEELGEKGVMTRPIWGLIHEQLPYLDAITYKIEKAEEYAGKIINIPCSTQITKEEMNYTAETILKLCQSNRANHS